MKARFLALAALVLGLASCQTEPEGLNVNVGGEVDTTITVSLPETTRANNSAEGAFVNVVNSNEYTIRYILQVFYGETAAPQDVKYSDGTSVNFDVRLVPGRDYKFVVWADVVKEANPTDLHYNTTDLTNITFNGDWNAMDETRDAFTCVEPVNDYSGTSEINIELTRPFAKLRVQTTDLTELANLGLAPYKTVVTYTTAHYRSFDALAGIPTDKTYAQKAHEIIDLKAKGYENETLFVDYFYATEEAETVKFEMAVYDANETEPLKTNNFTTDIPVQRNHLTTIKGNILTDGNNVKVTVDNVFENGSTWNPAKDEYDVEVVDVFDTDSFKAALTATSTDVVINANGAEINLNYVLTQTAIPDGRTVTICNANVVGRSYGNGVDGTVIFENCTFNNATGAYSIHFDNGNGNVIFKNCDLYGWNSFGASLTSVEFENCSLIGNGTYALIRSYVDLTLTNCVINTSNANHNDNYSEGVEAIAPATLTENNVTYVAENPEALKAALAAGKTNITLTAGNYELSGLNFAANDVTLKGVDKANVVLNLDKSIYLQNKSVTLENLTYNLNAGKAYDEHAFAFVHHATAFNLKNCNVNRLRLNVYEANIEDCTFTLNTSSGFDGYCIYYYGNANSTVNVKNSTFATAGKGICIYSEHAKAYNLNVDKCSFTSSDSATDKAAIQMHTEYSISGNVKITETTATGFANINGGLWNELNNSTKVATDMFDIWVDGTQVH